MVASSCLLAALLLVGGMSTSAAGLTVYRLGGEDYASVAKNNS